MLIVFEKDEASALLSAAAAALLHRHITLAHVLPPPHRRPSMAASSAAYFANIILRCPLKVLLAVISGEVVIGSIVGKPSENSSSFND